MCRSGVYSDVVSSCKSLISKVLKRKIRCRLMRGASIALRQPHTNSPALDQPGFFVVCASGDAGMFHHIDHPRDAKPVLHHAVHR
jgi:hypothetical protein